MTNEVKVPICKNCKTHTNNPSYCKLKDSYVGREHVCENHVWDKSHNVTNKLSIVKQQGE